MARAGIHATRSNWRLAPTYTRSEQLAQTARSIAAAIVLLERRRARGAKPEQIARAEQDVRDAIQNARNFRLMPSDAQIAAAVVAERARIARLERERED